MKKDFAVREMILWSYAAWFSLDMDSRRIGVR